MGLDQRVKFVVHTGINRDASRSQSCYQLDGFFTLTSLNGRVNPNYQIPFSAPSLCGQQRGVDGQAQFLSRFKMIRVNNLGAGTKHVNRLGSGQICCEANPQAFVHDGHRVITHYKNQ